MLLCRAPLRAGDGHLHRGRHPPRHRPLQQRQAPRPGGHQAGDDREWPRIQNFTREMRNYLCLLRTIEDHDNKFMTRCNLHIV